MTSLYDELGVAADAGAGDIKRAYRKAAKRTHPDNHETGDRAAFDRVQRAWLILSDADRRARYDRGEPVDEDLMGGGESMVISLLAKFFTVVLAKFDPQYDDLVGETRKLIELSIDTGRKQLDKTRKAIDAFEKAQGRLTTADDRNILGGVIASRLADERRRLVATEAELTLHADVLDLCNAHSYRADPRPASAGWPSASRDRNRPEDDLILDLMMEQLLRKGRRSGR
ncbi:MAG: hypothetical protein BGP16_05375 [Sphingobium sp. 66-54]|nr:MAG: hypothetical protein BGP16_05375 [Sphingobium sp. 66-54]